MKICLLKRIARLFLMTVILLSIGSCSNDSKLPNGTSIPGLWLTESEPVNADHMISCQACKAMVFTKKSVTTYGWVYSISNPFKDSGSLKQLPGSNWYYLEGEDRTYGYITDGNTIVFGNSVYTCEGNAMFNVNSNDMVYYKQ